MKKTNSKQPSVRVRLLQPLLYLNGVLSLAHDVHHIDSKLIYEVNLMQVASGIYWRCDVQMPSQVLHELLLWQIQNAAQVIQADIALEMLITDYLHFAELLILEQTDSYTWLF